MDVVRVATDTSSSDKRVVARLGCTSVVFNTISLNQEVHNTLKVRPAYRVGSDAGRGTVSFCGSSCCCAATAAAVAATFAYHVGVPLRSCYYLFRKRTIRLPLRLWTPLAFFRMLVIFSYFCSYLLFFFAAAKYTASC